MVKVEFSDESVGGRIRYARESLGMSQGALADELGVDRSAIVRIEKGTRKVSATELAALGTVLDRSFSWFLQPDTPVVAARRAASVYGDSTEFERVLEELMVAVRWMSTEELLPLRPVETLPFPVDHSAAESAAGFIRKTLGIADRPLTDLSAAAEQLGLLPFCFNFPDTRFDGSMVEVDALPAPGRLGVTLINGVQRPGRRRFTLAHELGHWVFGDQYDDCQDFSPNRQLSSAADREKMIDSFAAHLLLPRAGVTLRWNSIKRPLGERDAALTISSEYRTSWSATLGQLSNLGLIGHATHDQLSSFTPRRRDFDLLGLEPGSELAAPHLPSGYRSAVLRSYRNFRITTDKTLDLLFGTLTEDQLPAREEPPRRRRRRPDLRPVMDAE